MSPKLATVALVLAVGVSPFAASSVKSGTSDRRWTLGRARSYLMAQSPLDIVDMRQADRPEFLVRFTARDGLSLRPLGRGRAVNGRRTWQRFSFAGSLFDVQRAVPVRVRFVLQASDGGLTDFHGPLPNRFQPRFPLRTTVYYEWFPEGWTQEGIFPYTRYHPSLGYYSSDDPRVVRRHIASMLYGHFAVAAYDWWGQTSNQDARLPLVLSLSRQTPLRWAIYYEEEGYGNPSPAEIHADLVYLRGRYFSNPAYLKIGGRPVVFAYADSSDDCSMAERWRTANEGIGAYLVLSAFPRAPQTVAACADQPDAWHVYSATSYEFELAPWDFGITPGFDKFGTPYPGVPVYPRDLARWRQQIRDMVASKMPWQLVLTFNEWGEDTSIESAQEWATPSGYGAYLDALHEIR
ncbi:MAG: hypothetical protein C5B48_11245 [Candidatus Rokuibacteriota bacterium]|nr:MAG: hypothetical protein C5B48_11245 [Candidatus Rokubacteria bacterium]